MQKVKIEVERFGFEYRELKGETKSIEKWGAKIINQLQTCLSAKYK